MTEKLEKIRAFPMHFTDAPESDQYGMTLRDYFAAAALTGYSNFQPKITTVESVAGWAYAIADAMLKARHL